MKLFSANLTTNAKNNFGKLPFCHGNPSHQDNQWNEESGGGDGVGDVVASGHVREGEEKLVPTLVAVAKAPVLNHPESGR